MSTATARSREVRASIDDHRTALLAVLDEYGAENPRLFGSVVRGEATNDSDLDLLVHLRAPISLFELARRERDLSEILGIQIDVVPDAGLRRTVRPRALAEAVSL